MNVPVSRCHSLHAANELATERLLAARDARGVWTGLLSASALSTATAVSALASHYGPDSFEYEQYVVPAVGWLMAGQNADGGWGDTSFSYSNISTTMLVRAALSLAGKEDEYRPALARAAAYVESQGGVSGLKRRYGRDKTFAVPILANAAIAGQVGWNEVSRLPFELACFPQSWYRHLKLPVVSYAIPALVAVGQAIHHGRGGGNPLLRWLRNLAIEPSLRVLQRIQPASGGYLEAIPLTSFVAMSLISCDRGEHPVTQACLRFIRDTVRDDGSWPIDTNLATWNTTLALNALTGSVQNDRCRAEQDGNQLTAREHTALIAWLLDCQNTEPHPFTGAAPGGWGWSDLSGAVPDADDTPGALLALRYYCAAADADPDVVARAKLAAAEGVQWLLDLQNRDGGWPTFCRGWGKLPFDRSGSDLTAHALRALYAWSELGLQRSESARHRGWRYLGRNQNEDGSWTPLWFGNQDHPQEENPVYGTAKCLMAYRDCGRLSDKPAQAAATWLLRVQNEDGGWGGDGHSSSVEETSLAVEALSACFDGLDRSNDTAGIQRGVDWLVSAVENGEQDRASPIGLYFAKLWYYESIYPLVFSASALRGLTKSKMDS